MKRVVFLMMAFCAIAFTAVGQLHNTQTLGQSTRNQKVIKGLQVGDSGSPDTTQINGKLQLTTGAGLGKVLTSSATGIASWNSVSAAIKTSNGIQFSADTLQLGGALNKNTVIETGSFYFKITDTTTGLMVGIVEMGGIKHAMMRYEDDTTRYELDVNQYGAFVKHYNRDTADHLDGLLSVVHYENSLNRYRPDGTLLAISNTNDINIMSISDNLGEISRIQGTDSVIDLVVNRTSKFKCVGDAVVGEYAGQQKWRIDDYGIVTVGKMDSADIWALSPVGGAGSHLWCNNCKDADGDTGCYVRYNGTAWKKED